MTQLSALIFKEKINRLVNLFSEALEKEIDSVIISQLNQKLTDPNVSGEEFKQYFKELQQAKHHTLGTITQHGSFFEKKHTNSEQKILQELLNSKKIDRGRTFSYISNKLLGCSLGSLRVLLACLFGLDMPNKGIITADDYKKILNRPNNAYKEMKENIETLRKLKVEVLFKDTAPKPYPLYVFESIEYDDSVRIMNDRHITYRFTTGIDDVLSIIFQLLLRPEEAVENRYLNDKDINYLSRVYKFKKRYGANN
ncbi:RepB family plasmid replication initiator protein [Bacillus toyonensis]|uniref:RepB family plasmid replication initiator protein n=1 Tax=Bacillus toyonensis TaxID=155322 RepID=UPI003D1E4EB1